LKLSKIWHALAQVCSANMGDNIAALIAKLAEVKGAINALQA